MCFHGDNEIKVGEPGAPGARRETEDSDEERAKGSSGLFAVVSRGVALLLAAAMCVSFETRGGGACKCVAGKKIKHEWVFEHS